MPDRHRIRDDRSGGVPSAAILLFGGMEVRCGVQRVRRAAARRKQVRSGAPGRRVPWHTDIHLAVAKPRFRHNHTTFIDGRAAVANGGEG